VKTLRQKMIALLEADELSARDLSRYLNIREKDVQSHLDHIARSVAAHNKTLVIRPCRCLQCGFVFRSRRRVTRPGRCPRCKTSRLEAPLFKIA
jgi:hypothetical protein